MIHAIVLCLQSSTPMTVNEVREASKKSLDALNARFNLERASLQKVTSRSAILPSVSLSLSANDTLAGPQRIFSTVPEQGPNGDTTYVQRAVDTPSFSQGRFNFDVGVSQLLYDGGRWWNQMALSGHQEEASRGQLAEQQLSSALEAERRFYVLLQGQLALKVLEETRRRSLEQIDRAKSLFEAARGSRGAVLDAQTSAQSDAISIARQKRIIKEAQLSLLQWIARPEEDIEAVAPEVQGTPLRPTEQWVALAQIHRPLFRSLQAQKQAAEAQIAVSGANFFPRVSVRADYQRNAPSADPFFTDFSKQNVLSLGANLSWDLFNGFADDALVKRAKVDLTAFVAQAQQTLIDLRAEIARNASALESGTEILRLGEANVQLAKEQVSFEEERFKAGAGSSIEVRNALLKLTQAQLQVLQSQAEVAISLASINRAIGNTFEEKP
jgi:outer membrane protein